MKTLMRGLSAALALLFCLGGIAGATHKITVKVRDTAGHPLVMNEGDSVRVILAGFPAGTSTMGSEPDPDATAIKAGLDEFGNAVFDDASKIKPNYRYMVIVDAFGYQPTAGEQFNGVELVPPVMTPPYLPSDGFIMDVYPKLAPLTDSSRYGKVKIVSFNISTDTVKDSTPITAEIRNAGTGALAGFGFSQVLEKSATIYINNVLAESRPDTYKAFIGVVQNVNKIGLPIAVSTSIIAGQTRTLYADFLDSYGNSDTDNPDGTASNAAISGVVTSTMGIPLEGARVELMASNGYQGTYPAYQTYTDRSGNFSFYNIALSTYMININKRGYIGRWDQNPMKLGNVGTASIGYLYDGKSLFIPWPYQLERGPGRIIGRVVAYDEQYGAKVGVANAHINVWGNWDAWPEIIFGNPYGDYYTAAGSWDKGGKGWADGVTDKQGYFTVDGLGSGNFELNIWTDNGQYRFNDGENQTRDWSNVGGVPVRGGDDLRIQIATATYSTKLYSADSLLLTNVDEQGAVDPFEIITSTIPERGGRITGTVTFKDFAPYADRGAYVPGSGYQVKISSLEPVTIIAWEESRDSGPRKLYSWDFSTDGLAPASTSYIIAVSSDTAYWLEMRSKRWGLLNQQDTRCDLRGSMEISDKNFILVPAGSMRVLVRDPDGNIIRRSERQMNDGSRIVTQARIMLEGPTYWETELSDQGETEINGLVPGVYRLVAKLSATRQVMNGGDLVTELLPEVYPPAVVSDVNVSVDKTTYVNVRMKPAALVTPAGSALTLPPLPDGTKGFYSLGGWKAGTVLTSNVLRKTLFSSKMRRAVPDITTINFAYDTERGAWDAKRIPDSKFDFYLGYINLFNTNGEDGPINNRQNFTAITTLPGFNITYDSLNSDATTFITLGSGSLGNCTIRGTLKGAKAISRRDVDRLIAEGGDSFFYVTPGVMVYDQQGNWKGYAAGLPPTERLEAAWGPIMENSSGYTPEEILAFFSRELAAHPMEYEIEKLPAGKYTLVFDQINYPPLMKQITITSGVNTLNIDFDQAVISGSLINGVVKSTDNAVIMGANVVVRNKNANIEKTLTTNESGVFTVNGIPPGVYRIDVSRGGYALGGTKVTVGYTPADVELLLQQGDASVSGTVYTQRMPAKVLTGAKIAAYDETMNGENAGAYLPTYKALTDNYGQYFLPGLITGHTYKIHCIADNKILEWRSVEAASGENTGIDFTLRPSKPRLKVNVRKVFENNRIAYNFLIEVPSKLVNPRNPSGVAAPYCCYSPVADKSGPFDPDRATELLVEPGPNNTYSVTFRTPSDDEYFKMRILAFDGINEYFEDILFGPKIEARVKKDVSGELAEGGQIEIDATGGDTTKIGLDAGAITPADFTETTENQSGEYVPIGGFLSALPNFQLSREQSSRALAMQNLVDSIVASDVYEVDLTSAQLNKAVTLTLNYNREKVGEDELSGLLVGRFNAATGTWEILPGVPTVDPLTGTVSIDVDSVGGTNAAPAPKAKFNGRMFAINRAAALSQSGVYAVFTQDPGTIAAFSGSTFEISNFPNPFDLKLKNVTLQDVTSDAGKQVLGTMIKYALPRGTKGRIEIFIYNIAGELVRTLDLGDKDETANGHYYYVEWDGKNDNGEECASGIYFGIAKCSGKKLNGKPLKMAIVK